MNRKPTRAAAFTAGILVVAAAVAGPPAPPPQTLPGAAEATIGSRWIAPRVSVTALRPPGGATEYRVTWFAADGKVRRELTSATPPSGGFVSEVGEGGAVTAHAVGGDWRVVLPARDVSASLQASRDGRVLVHRFHPRDGQSAADVYVEGKLAGTLGPFATYRLDDVTLGDDGSIAMLSTKDGQKGTPQVVVAGPDGKERFRAACDEPASGVQPAPDGAAALVRSEGAGRVNRFTLYAKDGKVSSVDVGPNARFVAWTGAAPVAVLETSGGDTRTWQLIDWRDGKRLLSIPDPNPGRVTWAACPVAVEGQYLLIGGLEYLSYERQAMPVRSIYAVGLTDGRLLAHWLPAPKHQFSADAGDFLRLGQRLYFVADEAYCQIMAPDIPAHRSGWRE